jgi:hypothetical protein
MRYVATIQWLDDKSTQEGVIFKIGDVGEDDDDVFFYLESESEVENFKKEGANDFIILSIEKEDLGFNLPKHYLERERQTNILRQIQVAGFNVMTCGNCGATVLGLSLEEECTCPGCLYTSDPCDFPDLYTT